MHRLSELQLDLMQVLWDLGEASVADVHQRLESGRGLAYTTVATLLKRLEDKGVVVSRREGRTLVYAAAVGADAVQRTMVGRLVDQLFRGDPAALVSQLLGDERVSADDVDRIRDLLDRYEEDHPQ